MTDLHVYYLEDDGTEEDVSAPSAPEGLAASATSPSRVALSWDPASDDTAVDGYDVRRDGAVVATTSATTYADDGLAPETTYAYTVEAFDAAGNRSGRSGTATASTPAEGGPAPPPPAGGLVAYYAFDEGGGAAAAGAPGPDGALRGSPGPAWTADPAPGGGGHALRFDGGGYVDVPADTGPLASASFTLAAWVRVPERAPGYRVIAEHGRGTANWYGLYKNARHAFHFRWGPDGRRMTVDFGPAVEPGRWYHVAGTFDAGSATARVYVDGAAAGGATGTPVPTPRAGPFRVGINGDGDEPFVGAVDEVRVYARALSASEVAGLARGDDDSPVSSLFRENATDGAPDTASLFARPDNFLLPEVFEVGAVSPNPSNGRSELVIAVPESRRIVIQVYNLLGQRITTLQDGTLNAGTHSIALDRTRLPAGTYMVTVRSGSYSGSQKFTVIN